MNNLSIYLFMFTITCVLKDNGEQTYCNCERSYSYSLVNLGGEICIRILGFKFSHSKDTQLYLIRLHFNKNFERLKKKMFLFCSVFTITNINLISFFLIRFFFCH